uniref:Alginate lyase family protein n=1 Tax=Roseihalotalea indica TaxID=2867963 RepID=A0AA49GKD7_9BACT|nr:alginate lyase family protein [Tunicatimonas sp. TK19036]
MRLQRCWLLVVYAVLTYSSSYAQVISASPNSIQPVLNFVHPGMYQNKHDLEHMKAQIEAGEEPWRSAFERLKAETSLEFTPEPFVHVVRGSYGKGSVGGNEFRASASASYRHALMWYITDEKAYAEKAIEIINAWSPVIWDFEGNDAKVLIGWAIHEFCNAAEILRYTDSGWEKQDIEAFQQVLLSVYYPVIEHFFPEANGNWDAAIINTMMCIGVFCDNPKIYNRAVDQYLRGIRNGGFTKYFYPHGQCQESTRDQGHTQLGMDYFAKACKVAWTQGQDLYSLADNRLALAFEYTAQYMLGQTVEAYGVISPKERDEFRDIYETVYHHFTDIEGVAMPYTAQAVAHTRDQSTMEALTSFRAPSDYTKQTKEEPLQLYPMVGMRGAREGVSAQPPSGAIHVAPGDSIQAALNQAATSGGWVVLERGLHTIFNALRIPSGVTLSGEGRESIIFMEPGTDMFAMVNDSDDMHDVVLRDFVVEGAATPQTSSDPNQDRRNRSVQVAPVRGGINFASQQAGQMKNIHLENLTVWGCTHNGVAIRGAEGVTISSCDFSDNGGSVVPGVRLLHNLFVTRTINCKITDNRLADSPWGCGLELTHSRDVEIKGNEIARNGFHGFRAAESQSIQVRNNLLEGNDAHGITFTTYWEGCSNISVRDNIMHFNGRDGFYAEEGSSAETSDNEVTHNGESVSQEEKGE